MDILDQEKFLHKIMSTKILKSCQSMVDRYIDRLIDMYTSRQQVERSASRPPSPKKKHALQPQVWLHFYGQHVE